MHAYFSYGSKYSRVAVWLSANMLVMINEVELRRAQLVSEWVTVLEWVKISP